MNPLKTAQTKIKQTKEALINAFLRMFTQMQVEKISICALCEAAGVNRHTFYCHYSSIVDMIDDYENRIADEIFARIRAMDIRRILIEPMRLFDILSDWLKQNEVFAQYLQQNENCVPFFHKIAARIAAHAKRFFSSHGRNDKQLLFVSSDYVVYGVISIYQQWFLDGGKASLDTLLSRLKPIIMNGIHPLLYNVSLPHT